MSTPYDWQAALETFLDQTWQACREANVEFIITGSCATALQKCDLVPGDIDILVTAPESVKFIADLMADFEIEEFPSNDVELWYSSAQDRVFVLDNKEKNEMWHMGRWVVNGVKIEVGYIHSLTTLDESHEAGYIWENGPDMYAYAKEIPFRGYLLKVTPLEIQLSSNFFLNFHARIKKIAQVMQSQGYNPELLRKALTPAQYSAFSEILDRG